MNILIRKSKIGMKKVVLLTAENFFPAGSSFTELLENYKSSKILYEARKTS